MTKQFTVGDAGAPTAGQTTFTADFLQSVFVDYIIVNNDIETQLGSATEFTHSYIQGMISRGTNIWVTGDNLIVVYTPKCNCGC